MAREVHIELLIQCCVVDQKGEKIGRITDICCEKKGGEWVVVEYLAAGAVKLFSARGLALWLIHLFGGHHFVHGLRIPWEQLDLSDPDHPRLRCRRDELKRI
jgi:sporulation protein YlmC with PRC-barrel domain